MARKTFGPSGRKIELTDDTADNVTYTIVGEDEPTANSDNHSGADGNLESADTGSDREDTDTAGNLAGEAGKQSGDYTNPVNATIPKRRGRPRGSTNRKTAGTNTAAGAESTAFITANLEKVLYNLHKMGAGLLNVPELAIEQNEAALLAEAVKEVATAYDFSAILNPKTQAWIDFGIACTAVYGERVLYILHKPKRGPQVINAQPIHPVENIKANAQ